MIRMHSEPKCARKGEIVELFVPTLEKMSNSRKKDFANNNNNDQGQNQETQVPRKLSRVRKRSYHPNGQEDPEKVNSMSDLSWEFESDDFANKCFLNSSDFCEEEIGKEAFDRYRNSISRKKGRKLKYSASCRPKEEGKNPHHAHVIDMEVYNKLLKVTRNSLEDSEQGNNVSEEPQDGVIEVTNKRWSF